MRESKDKLGQGMCMMALAAVLVLFGFGVMLYCEWRGSFQDTLYVLQKTLWVMPLFVCLIGAAHYNASKEMSLRKYIKQIFCGKDTLAGRRDYLDYARVFAAVMVILTHACSMQTSETAAAWKINLLLLCTGVGLVCNPLYVMISGALLLSSKKEEDLGVFYFRRFVKVVIPMIVYYAIFLCVSGQVSFLPPRNLREGLLHILGGASGIVPHYWLIYTLISLYVTAPFVRVMVQNLKDSQITVLFFLILIEEALTTYLLLTGVHIGFAMNLASWEGVFILGYILTSRRTKLIERFVLVFGAVSFVIVSVVWVFYSPFGKYVSDTSPVMVLFAGWGLTVLSKLENVLKDRSSSVIRTLSKYSYSVILVHWYGLFVVTYGKIGVQPLRFGCIGGIALTVLIAVMVCFVMGFIADNTIVLVVQYSVGILAKLMKKLKTGILTFHKTGKKSEKY